MTFSYGFNMGLENKVEVSLALWKGKNELEGRSGDETV
jgi:hypothetical protein